MNWHAEPFWVWWSTQKDVIAQTPAPDLQLTAAVTEITQLLRGDQRQARAQRLGELHRGTKYWKRRR